MNKRIADCAYHQRKRLRGNINAIFNRFESENLINEYAEVRFPSDYAF